MGGYYGGRLAQAGCEVHFAARGDFEALRDGGLRLMTPRGEVHLPHLRAHRSAETMPTCDVVLVALKATQLGAAGTYLPRVLSTGGRVVALQNGLGAEEELARYVDPERLWGGACYLCAHRAAPGHIHQSDVDWLRLAPYRIGASEGPIRGLIEALMSAGLDARSEPDLPALRWRKLVWNIPFNGLCTLLEKTTSELLASPGLRELVAQLMTEVMRAGQAVAGQPLPEALVENLLSMTETFEHYKPSMLADWEAGRPLEVEAIHQIPVARARQAGCPMPRAEMLATLLHARAEARGREPAPTAPLDPTAPAAPSA